MSYRKHLMPSDIAPSAAYEATAVDFDTDTISRAKAIEAIDEIESEIAEGFGFEYEKWRKYFCDLPPAQPEHIRGRWIPVGGALYQCDQCGVVSLKRKFCSECGADMREVAT